MAMITTICIVGFPAETGPRELKNLCRFMPGFEGAHVAFAGPGTQGTPTALFVKFNSIDLATTAIEQIHGTVFDTDAPQHTLKAEFARREMEVRPGTMLPAPLVTPPAAPLGLDRAVARPAATLGLCQNPPGMLLQQPVVPQVTACGYGGVMGGGPGKRVGSTGGELVTITILGMKDKGLVQEELQQWFQERPGFITSQINERIDGIFVKFNSQEAAEQAIQDATQYGAEWARRNLDDDLGGRLIPVMPTPSYPRQGCAPQLVPAGCNYAGTRRLGSTGGELVTITVLGIKEKGLSQEELQNWFQQRPGFLNMQVNDRIGAIFVKFMSGQTAEQAIYDANQMQFGAEWARRNLDDDLASKAVVAPYSLPTPMMAPAACGVGAAPAKRPRNSSGELDTITILGVREKELIHGNLQAWFQERPGFVALQMSERIDGLFVKFQSAVAAEQAILDANAMQIGAEWARRNLDL